MKKKNQDSVWYFDTLDPFLMGGTSYAALNN